MNFVAVVLAKRTPTPVQILAQETGYTVNNVRRLLERMQKHFPIDVVRGHRGGAYGATPMVVTVRRRA